MPVDLKVDIRDSGTKRQRAILTALNKQDGAFLEVGIFAEALTDDGEQISNYAAANEFGINIPERSFMRTAFDENVRKFEQRAAKQERLIVDGKKTIKGALASVGFDIVKAITTKIKSNIPPPLSEARLAQKPPITKTLVETGAMLRSLTAKVTIGGKKRVEI